MRSTFRLLFYVNRQKIKANDCCPIMGRITIDGKIANYSTGLEIDPNGWNADKGRAKNDKEANRQLDELERKAQSVYTYHLDAVGYVSAEIIKNAITGCTKTSETLLTLFDEHNAESERRVGIDLARQSYIRHKTTRRHIADFLRYKYDLNDVALRAIDMQFVVDFELYLMAVQKLTTNSINSYVNVLRKVIRLAVKQKTIYRDPLEGYRLEKQAKQYRHLTAEQLQKLMQAELSDEKLRYTRDLFVFSCFTGLGQGDLSKLTKEHITTDNNGGIWLKIERSKTGIESVIKLLDTPLLILERYTSDAVLLFTVPKTEVLCDHLKAIVQHCGIDVHLTFYMARHTFATEVCLNNGVPIETISKMLGHTSIKTTQVYAEITNQKLTKDLQTLAKTANQKYKLQNIEHL